MSDGMPGGTRAPMIAIGAAVVALVTSLIAVIVVANRTDKPSGSQAGPLEQHVAAADVAKLKRDSVENVTDAGKVLGVKVIDTKVRESLGLEADDIITGIAGRTIKREFDVYDAVLGMSMMDTSVVYVDLLRDKKPMLVRWQLDGDLRSARRSDDSYGSGRATPPIRGGIGSTVDPFGVATPRDPLLDTITKVDEFHYEVPRSTIERIVANSTDYMKGARVVPSMKNGAAEGFKLYAIRPTSVWSAVGFQNGDTIRAVNGFETDSIDKAAEIYTKVKDAKELAIDITRRGRYELLTITIK